MKKPYLILTAVMAVITSHKINSQSFTPALTIPVTVNGNQIVNPWAGGLNSPQFSEIDLNGDGIKDLVVFEAEGTSGYYYRHTTYINNGTANQVDYHYAPQYISKFPNYMHNWTLLADYNCDGKEDIFTCSYYGGITVYKNISVAGNLQFALEDTLLYSNYYGFIANLFVAANKLPALTDIDGDGDMDILVPSTAGYNIEFHKNFSMDNYGICDSLIFVFDTSGTGWGGWSTSFGNNGRTLLAFDNDYDGDKDLLTYSDNFGNVSYLSYYENTGTSQNANLVLIDDSFPSYNIPAKVRQFPGCYYLDVNNDNKKDLLVASSYPNSENIKNVQYYNNIATAGTNNFNLVNHSFLGDNMIDVGAGANVRFFDVDNDGLQDLIIGNNIRIELASGDTASLSFYRNIGTAVNPAFQFVTNNFANINSTGVFGLAPTFGDIDGDGDDDMLIGHDDGTLILYTNSAGNFAFTVNNYQGIDVGAYCTPYLFDVNQDGLMDLICGTKPGKLYYYQNTGTATTPVFSLINSFWGAVNVTPVTDIYGYSYPFIYNKNGSLELLVGNLSGFIYRYGNISGNLGGTFTLLDTMYGNINEPVRATVAGTDINGDGTMDLAVGNYAGGLTVYTQTPTGISENNLTKEIFDVFPNPNAGLFDMEFYTSKTVDAKISLQNIIGQQVFEKNIKSLTGLNTFKIDLNNFDNGIYLLQLTTQDKTYAQKIIIYR